MAAPATLLPTSLCEACCCGQGQGRKSKKNTSCISERRWRLRCHLGQDDSVKVHCEDGREPHSFSCRSCFWLVLLQASLVWWLWSLYVCYPSQNVKCQVAKKTDKSWAETKHGSTSNVALLEWKVWCEPLYLYSGKTSHFKSQLGTQKGIHV